MKRDNGKSTDLLVCFPTRAHLTLMPKPICSPARTSSLDRHQNNKQIKKFICKRNKSNNNGGVKASPVLWARTKSNIIGSEIISEPTSPKVTCSGQIKIRPKTNSSKNWQSVMEEIERIHNHKKQREKPTWVESLGFKKEIVQFLTCLRTFRFDFRCFGSFPSSDLTSDDDEDDDDRGHNHDDSKNNDNGGDHDEDDDDRDHDHDDSKNNDNGGDHDEDEDGKEDPRTVFSKWYMVLQDGKTNRNVDETEETKTERICVPPPNALLLMRCRSAPAKSWLEEKEEEEEEEEEMEEEVKRVKGEFKKAKLKLRELFTEEEQEELKMKTENELLIMRYDTDFYKLSSDIAKETWVVGGGGGGGCASGRDSFSRSLSWKR